MHFKSVSEHGARTLAALFLATSLLLAAVLAGTWVYTYRLIASNGTAAPVITPPVSSASPLQVLYQLDVPGRGEIFPALSAGNPTDYWPVAILTIANTSNSPTVQTVSAGIIDWSTPQIKTMVVGPRQTVSVRISPELLPEAYENTEIRKAMLQVSASSPGNQSAYTQTRPVYLHSVSDFFWGEKFANAQFIARWVTPHDPAVIQLVSSARKYVPRGRLAGYNLPGGKSPGRVATQVQREMQAVFQAMSQSGISYVDSLYTFGNFTSTAERVRLPRETLQQDSANCIDVSVAFASAMENLGMDPVIVIVPGHAFTGVRLGPDSRQIVYFDLTVLPDGSPGKAMSRAQYWLKKTPPDRLLVVDIAAARKLQIYPLPQPVGRPS